jgi:hypothetical protein
LEKSFYETKNSASSFPFFYGANYGVRYVWRDDFDKLCFIEKFFFIWMRSFFLAFLVAFPTAFFVAPMVQKIVKKICD